VPEVNAKSENSLSRSASLHSVSENPDSSESGFGQAVKSMEDLTKELQSLDIKVEYGPYTPKITSKELTFG
jgi:hypothetical protein